MTTTLTSIAITPGATFTTRIGNSYTVAVNSQVVVANADVTELLASGNFVPLDPNFAGASRTSASLPVRLQLPPGLLTITTSDGTSLTAAADGTVTANAARVDVIGLLRLGCTVAPASGTTGGRPAICAVGTTYFDTSLSKPIFRTAAAGWCDAAGSAT